MARTWLRLSVRAAGVAVPLVILGAATPPAYADDVEIGPDVDVGPAVEISPGGTAVLPDDIWAMIDEGSTLQPPPGAMTR
jgi:hypothetical protein